MVHGTLYVIDSIGFAAWFKNRPFWVLAAGGGLAGGLGGTPPPGLRLLEPAALAGQVPDMAMRRQPIEQRAGQTLAAEDTGPFLERQVRSDDGRAAFMTLAADLEKELGAGLRGRHTAGFVEA